MAKKHADLRDVETDKAVAPDHIMDVIIAVPIGNVIDDFDVYDGSKDGKD